MVGVGAGSLHKYDICAGSRRILLAYHTVALGLGDRVGRCASILLHPLETRRGDAGLCNTTGFLGECTMTPAETAMLMNVLVGAGIVFVIALLGNTLSFSNRFVNALVTAIIFALFYGALAFGIDKTMLPAELQTASQETWIQMIAMGAVLVFVLDLVANMISFGNRFLSALVTAALFAVLFGAAVYTTGGVPTSIPTAVPAPAAAPVTP